MKWCCSGEYNRWSKLPPMLSDNRSWTEKVCLSPFETLHIFFAQKKVAELIKLMLLLHGKIWKDLQLFLGPSLGVKSSYTIIQPEHMYGGWTFYENIDDNILYCSMREQCINSISVNFQHGGWRRKSRRCWRSMGATGTRKNSYSPAAGSSWLKNSVSRK